MGAKIIYNLKGISRMLTPRAFTQPLLKHKIESIFKLDDKTLESIASRVAHYHKINERFEIAPFVDSGRDNNAGDSAPSAPFVSSRQRLGLANPHFGLLKDNKLSKEHSSVYFYDSYEWTRYFPGDYRWYYEFGDVNYYLTAPTITKTRPIDARADSDKLDSNALDFSARESNHAKSHLDSSLPESSASDSASQNYSPPLTASKQPKTASFCS
ncbi:hypothetical protein BKN38_07880 [Helicobacter sp. CLO-3]|uniref:hypothetical protein n=1 Tax=unclassified Helicobacter TaxID=2593540 RepID=UPI0008D94B3E|nr:MULTISPECIES: hypothetical protein [unclassified Helicobacter]OHU81952.1 hypothetical protein BKN38_07880 [Helicobacter sp. CLO-3]